MNALRVCLSEDEEGDGEIRYCLMPTSDNHLLRFISRRHKSLSLAILRGELLQFQVTSLTRSVGSENLKLY